MKYFDIHLKAIREGRFKCSDVPMHFCVLLASPFKGTKRTCQPCLLRKAVYRHEKKNLNSGNQLPFPATKNFRG